MPASQQITADDLLKIRGSLVATAMTCFTDDDGVPISAFPVHRLMAFVMERDYLGHSLIVAPPAHAKTFWCGNFFCAWKLGNDPSLRIAYVSATATHSLKQSVNIRDIIRYNPAFRVLFPTCLPDPDKGWGEIEWFLKKTSTNDPNASFFAVGIDGALLGSRQDYIIFDDVNTQKQQRSETMRQQVREWVANTAKTRLTPKGRMIDIQTRWHEEDLAGWCVEQKWTNLRFKGLADDDGPEQWAELAVYSERLRNAVAIDLLNDGWRYQIEEAGDAERGDRRWIFRIFLHENGPALWPERYSNEYLLEYRAQSDPRVWACVYQGSPVPDSGAIIPIDKFQTYDATDRGVYDQYWVQKVQAWDTAYSKKSSADYTVCVTMGLGRDGNYYLLDVLRKRLTFPQAKEALQAQFAAWRPNVVLMEEASSGISLMQEFERPGDGFGRLPLVGVKPREIGIDKESRAFAVTGYIEARRVFLPDKASWVPDFLAECGLFPNGVHDDQVDAFVLALHRLVSAAGVSMVDDDHWSTETYLGDVRNRDF